MIILELDSILGIICSSLLILMYGQTLFTACRGSKYKFVIRILVLLLLS